MPQCKQPGRVLSPACPLTASHYLAAMGGTNAEDATAPNIGLQQCAPTHQRPSARAHCCKPHPLYAIEMRSRSILPTEYGNDGVKWSGAGAAHEPNPSGQEPEFGLPIHPRMEPPGACGRWDERHDRNAALAFLRALLHPAADVPMAIRRVAKHDFSSPWPVQPILRLRVVPPALRRMVLRASVQREAELLSQWPKYLIRGFPPVLRCVHSFHRCLIKTTAYNYVYRPRGAANTLVRWQQPS